METLDTVEHDGRTLAQWHHWLTTDRETGESAGHLACFSRWGSTSDDCAWYAIALELVIANANGVGDTEGSLDHCMSLVVNEHDDVESLLKEYGYVLPDCLAEMLDLGD